jgi:broad specificity phosphatase PhoE
MSRPVFLIRHGPVELDLAVPAEQWQLSAAGYDLVLRLAALPCLAGLQTVWSSPEAKAVATARPLAQRYDLPLLLHPKLAELRRGPGNLPQRSEYEAAVSQAFAQPEISVNGWERACDARQRMLDALDEIAAASSGPIAVVSHGLALSLLVGHLRGQTQVDLAEWRAIPLPALAILDLDSRRLVAPFRSVESWAAQESSEN